jgi:dihydrofolate synthase/folylpolyglutamate synthase
LPEIAFQKAGIIKEACDVVLYPQQADVEKVFNDVCNELGAKLHKVSFDNLSEKSADIEGQVFDFEQYKDLRITLLGSHQTKNAAVAIKALECIGQKGYNITETIIRNGLLKTKWNGRFEVLKKQPVFLIDGAHNTEGATALAQSLVKYFPGKKITFILGFIKEKDFKPVVETLIPLANKVVTVTPNDPRGIPSEELAVFIEGYNIDVTASSTIKAAVEDCLKYAKDQDIICACGSLYYIGEVRSILCN